MQLPKHLLVPTDFSASADYALDYAIALAQRIGAVVDVLHVHPTPFLPSDITVSVSMLDRIVRDGEDALRRTVEPRRGCGVIGETFVKGGDPRDRINETVEERNIDLVVMGSHGKRGLRALFGSVTEGVLRTATSPVLALKPEPADGV